MRSALLDTLRSVLGPDHVQTDGDLSAFELDWRKRYRGKALAVVSPATTSEVATVMQHCAQHGVPVVPQGGNTGLVGGGVPDDSGTQVLLSLRRMRQVRSIDTANLTMTVEAGCVLQAAQDAAAAQNLLLPLSLASEGTCTVGGNLASNAGGTQVLRYGNARELCLGLEVVTPRGQVWNGLRGLRKDNTGYDLRHLYIGSEGTLGIITAAVMKLHPQPVAQVTALATTQSLSACVALLTLAQARAAASLTGFEVMNAFSLGLVGRHFPQLTQPLPAAPWTVLLEISDAESDDHARATLESLLAVAMAQGLVNDAAIASSQTQSRTMWHLRECISSAQAAEGLNIKHDISLPVSRAAAFVDAAGQRIAAEVAGARLVTFGHLGDGNLHFNVQAPVGVDARQFLHAWEPGINQLVYDTVESMGGSISAEHGIGVLKREELAQRQSPVARQLMQHIKHALDPQHLMNPGRLL